MDSKEELEIIRQKIDKIKKNRKKKQILSQQQCYNYKNIEIIPTIYDVVSSEKLLDMSSSIFIPQAPDLHLLMRNGDGITSSNYIPFNFVGEKERGEEEEGEKEKREEEKREEGEKKKNIFSSIYNYWFPVQEGAVGNQDKSSSGDFDINKVQFWNLPCNFLSMDFYTNLFANLVENTETYKDTAFAGRICTCIFRNP
jgi:hypothetical protein